MAMDLYDKIVSHWMPLCSPYKEQIAKTHELALMIQRDAKRNRVYNLDANLIAQAVARYRDRPTPAPTTHGDLNGLWHSVKRHGFKLKGST
jgi:transposase